MNINKERNNTKRINYTKTKRKRNNKAITGR